MTHDTIEDLRSLLGSGFSRYSSLSLIDSGSMGAVFRAFDAKLGREVALKVVQNKHIGQGSMRQRFYREAKILSDIRHPNVVRLYDFDEIGDVCFLVEEYVEGSSLLDEGVIEGEEKLLDIMAQSADGLSACHEKSVLHRDIKPANVVLDSSAKVLLIDFGLSQRDENTTSLTKTGYVVGTLGFIAPEILLGEEATAKSDLYQLGACFYAVLTGSLVYRQKDLAELFKSGVLEPPLPPSEAGAQCSDAVDRLVMSCLHGDPKKRPSSAGEFRDMCRDRQGELESPTLCIAADLDDTKGTSSARNYSFAHYLFPCLAFSALFLLLLLSFLSSSEEQLSIANLELRAGVDRLEATWTTDRPLRCSYRVREVLSHRLCFQGEEKRALKNHRILCSGLSPDREYRLLIGWRDFVHESSFETRGLNLDGKPWVSWVEDSFYIAFDLPETLEAKLSLKGSQGEHLLEKTGCSPLLAFAFEDPPDGVIHWSLSFGSEVLARGMTRQKRAQKPECFKERQSPVCSPLWSGESLYVADSRGCLTCYRMNRSLDTRKQDYGGCSLGWIFSPDDSSDAICGSLAFLNDRRILLLRKRAEQAPWRLYCLDPSVRARTWKEDGFASAKSLGEREWSRSLQEFKRVVYGGDMLAMDGAFVLQGKGDSPHWGLLDLRDGLRLRAISGKDLLPDELSVNLPSKKVLDVDMGSAPVDERGWGFLCNAEIKDGYVHSLIAFGLDVSKPVPSALFRVDPWEKKIESFAYRGLAARSGLTPYERGFVFPAGRKVLYFDDEAKDIRCIAQCKGGSLSSLVSVDGRLYGIHFAKEQEKSGALGGIKDLLSFKTLSLARVRPKRGAVEIYEPPLLREPRGAFQAASLYRFQRWEDYLFGHSFLSVFALNLDSGRFGSWRAFEGGVVASAINEDGIIALVSRSGKVLLLPLQSLLTMRSGKLDLPERGD